MFRFYSPQLLRGVGSESLSGAHSASNSATPRSRALFMARAVALLCGGHSALFCSRLWSPCGVPQWRPPHSAHTSPRVTAHTTLLRHQMCVHTRCLLHPASPHPDPLVALAFSDRELAAAGPTWTATHAACTSARACRCLASFAWCAALPSGSPLKPSLLSNTPMPRTRSASVPTRLATRSPSDPLARAHRKLLSRQNSPVVTGSAPLGRLLWA